MKKPKPQGQILESSVRHVVIESVDHISPGEVWNPAINIYETPSNIKVCVDLAGLDKKQICVSVEPGQLVISGDRHAPDPPQDSQPQSASTKPAVRIHAMEIDYGPFSRKIRIPHNVKIDNVESEYKLGLLWVKLPLIP
ncbi:Hsp20/alpha crystallin family protein [Planctomycetota bacterium]|nr:Hsp20/alpha crystallin family protein [Planctomycetota bacterium]